MPARRRIRPRGRSGAALLVALTLAIAALAACGEPGPPPLSRARALTELAASEPATPRPKHAGVSARWAPDVRPISPRRLGRDTLSADYRVLVQRCAGCHAIPDPRLHGEAEWSGVVTRMRIYTDSAGLLPLTPEQRAAVLRILRRHAR